MSFNHSFSLCTVASTLAVFALSSQAFSAPTTLASCNTDGEDHAVVLLTDGAITVDGEASSLVSATRTSDATGAIVYELLTTAGNELRLERSRQPAPAPIATYWDRFVKGGECKAGSTLDVKALNALVARSARLQRSTWRLADCVAQGFDSGRFTLDYTEGFVRGTIIVRSNVGPNAGSVAYVLSSFAQEGAAGSFYTTLGGEGAYSYSAAGRHSHKLGDLVLRHSNLTGSDSIETGESILDESLGTCLVTNLRHAQSLLER